MSCKLQITLNGDPHEVDGPLTVAELLAQLDIDARRVAVEHNLIVLKRDAFDDDDGPATAMRSRS